MDRLRPGIRGGSGALPLVERLDEGLSDGAREAQELAVGD